MKTKGTGRFLVAVRGKRRNEIFAFKRPSQRKLFLRVMKADFGKFQYATATVPKKR